MSDRTFGNEDRLPRVPLPTLEQSCARVVEWCAPLLTAEQLADTEQAVSQFLAPDSPAHALQAALVEYDATPGVASWLDDFWQSRYLGRRDRIALNANFFFLFNDTGENQVDRAAGLIAGAVDYKLRVDAETMPPAVARGVPQSMEQQKFLFSETRIPGAVQDTVRMPYTEAEPGPSTARHIAVSYRRNLFTMDVVGPDGVPYSLTDLAAGLSEVIRLGAEANPADAAVGALTTKARAEWAAARDGLLPANKDAFDAVETALFFLALDDLEPVDEQQASDHLLHGDAGNRWFDKSVSLIVFADGRAGINSEHLGLDGTTILGFVDFLLEKTSAEHAADAGARDQGTPAVSPVRFELTDAQRADIGAAAADFAQYAADMAYLGMDVAGFDAPRVKAMKVSPDGFVQMAYQLAHKRAKGFNGATYESIATRQFQNGRTEAMRVVTPQVLEFVAAMDDPAADDDTRRTTLRAAIDAHVARAKQCQSGAAPEQHLWELQLLQRRLIEQGRGAGLDAPLALYTSPGWTIMRDDYLSTSSAPSVNIQFFGFGSTSEQCIGLAYALLPARWNLYLSTPKRVEAQMQMFAQQLPIAANELAALLEA
ncbi:choline/carnitine O-acyltransferase [Skermania piniformis]|uniref:Choline/carnitine O-acyltransferase n=1 Tax=Skermania pinensis TaxID=39122 RepID=A0ABX8SD57_9ACTN|nr:choline/carnitine O-acyltransferase [Skermania piniformis]